MQLEQLIQRIRLGERAAVRELVAAYGNDVYKRAYERLQDRELAREAVRQIFGQLVAAVQHQPEADGWSLWFGDLIENNIASYARVGADMRYIESELEKELFDQMQPPARQPAPRMLRRADAYAGRTKAEEASERALANHADDQEPIQPLSRRDGGARRGPRQARASAQNPVEIDLGQTKGNAAGQAFLIALLTLICATLLWVVAGVAMTMKWIPAFNLGYEWFNQNVFQLF